MDYRYHTVEAENLKSAGYGENESLDFNLNFPGRALVCGSVRLEAEVEIYPDGTSLNDSTKAVHCDHMIGAHAFVGSCVTTFQQQGIVENATELPRYAKMVTVGTNTDQDMNQAKYVCELRSSDKMVQQKVLMPRYPADIGGGAAGDGVSQHQGTGFGELAENGGLELRADFSIKPVICLNGVASQNSLLNYNTSGEIKLSFNLARNLEALYGEDLAAAGKYLLKNVEVCYTSVPEEPTQAPITMRTSLCLKSNMNSSLSNHSARVPAICDAMSASYIQLGREFSRFHNNTALEMPPNVSNLKFMFNDSTSSYITYELRNRLEIIDQGLKALSIGSHHNVRGDLLSANESYVTGIALEKPLDLSRQKFNIQIDSEVDSSNPYLKFMYFHSLLSF